MSVTESQPDILAVLFVGPFVTRDSISAGAIRTLSAAGIKNFSEMLRVAGERAAMLRTVTPAEVGKTAAFLLSDVSSGITGQTVYVDCGYSIMAN